ncbi:MAG: 3,4-dihydroxy-2-butanone-4-phosphate synthase [Alphaproteobacteria bacterium]
MTGSVGEQAATRGSDDVAYLSSIEDVIEDARNGKLVVLIDDEGRENEGDLVIPAQMATPEAINFMATHGRGLICLTLPRERIEQLGLPLMPQSNANRLQTNFTVSIEAREGVSTGISAPDRARTIAAAIDPRSTADDIVTPGHIFPLSARDGGTLVRAGHTEASVDIARLAGLNPSAVICEIMNDDGTMSRLPDLVKFAQFHGLKIGSIADLIAFRRRHDRIVELLLETTLNSQHGGEFRALIYHNTVEYAEHVALVKGDITTDEPVLVRMHAMNLFSDVLGSLDGSGGSSLHAAMRMIGEAGRGAVVVIREPRPTALSDRIHESMTQPRKPVGELRDYGIGAQILLDIGVRDMILLSNSRPSIVGLDGFGLRVVDTRSLRQGDS